MGRRPADRSSTRHRPADREVCQEKSRGLPVTDAGTTLWTGFFTRPMHTAGLAHAVLVQAVYTGVFLIAATIRFGRSDVLT